MTESHHSQIHARVRRQYEAYPYPDIDPHTGRPQMLVSGHLSLMSDILWAGKRTHRGLRVLDAGCGTGAPLTGMARMYPDAHITGIDFSESSINKARQLAQRAGVENVRFIHMPIQQLPELGETFDFVVSSGVLHHLPDPAAGLAAIGKVLDPQGAVSIMLYGAYGRTGIYMVQNALTAILDPDAEMDQKILFARELAESLPAHHPMTQRARGRELQEGKDAGIVDLLLHANDIPFDVPAVYRLCADAGMRFHRWLFPRIYNPANFITDPRLSARMQTLAPPKQHELAELLHGGNSKHSFFAVGPQFQPPATGAADIKNGGWRKLYGKLTPCLAWNRAVPTGPDAREFVVPNAVVQDEWEPIRLKQWQLVFLGNVQPGRNLGKIAALPAVRQVMPFQAEAQVNEAVEELLTRVTEVLGMVLLERPDFSGGNG